MTGSFVIETASTATDVLTMLIGASHDPSLVDATYLPARLEQGTARRWVDERAGNAWVLRLDGEPVGWYEVGPVRSACGFLLPENTFEREVWLIPAARGRRLVRGATQAIAGQLRRRGVEHLVGITWETNLPAVKALANGGFRRLGRGWWEEPGERPGWCEVWLLDL